MDQGMVSLLLLEEMMGRMTEEELGIFIKLNSVNDSIQKELQVITPPELLAFAMKETLEEMNRITAIEDPAEQVVAAVKMVATLMGKMQQHPAYKAHEIQIKQVYSKYGIDYDKYTHQVLPKFLEFFGDAENLKQLAEKIKTRFN